MRVLVFVAFGLLASMARAQPGVPDETVERQYDHYPESNERRHDLFFEAIAGRGGAYLGVGSDQSYSLAAAARSELVFLLDYDPVIARLHRALVVLMARCPNVACLRDGLEPENEAATARLVANELSAGWEAQRTVFELRVHRPLLRRRIAELRRGESWVSRADWYAHLHRLAREGRIIARTGDLRGTTTLRAMAEAARRASVAFEVVYLSNAEEYISYDPSFVSNLAALPGSGRTLVLRTLRDHRLPRPPGDHGWHYDVQPLSDLLRRIRAHRYADSSWIVRDLLATHPTGGLSRLDARTPIAAQAGPRRWWLSAPGRRRSAVREGERSRVVMAVRRALAFADERVAQIDVDGTAIAHIGPAALPDDPRTERSFDLAGENRATSRVVVEAPEESLIAIAVDGAARELVPILLERAGLPDDAASLRSAPAVADLYGVYRLRERLLEICPRERRASGAAATALRACRDAAALVRPAPNRRALPGWPEREAAIVRGLRAIARDVVRVDGGATILALVERLAHVARAVRLDWDRVNAGGSSGAARAAAR